METLINIVTNVNTHSTSAFIQDRLQTIIDNLSEQDKLDLIKQANKSRLVNRISDMFDRKEINLEKDIQTFLVLCGSTHTRIAYNRHLTIWLAYCDSVAIDPRLCVYENARDFLLYLLHNGKSSAVIRQTITCLKSFYDYLWDTHELHVGNPFSNKSLLPKKERIKPLVIPTHKEYDCIKSTYSHNEDKRALLDTLYIIITYGVRISAFHNFEIINQNHIRITNTKAKSRRYDVRIQTLKSSILSQASIRIQIP